MVQVLLQPFIFIVILAILDVLAASGGIGNPLKPTKFNKEGRWSLKGKRIIVTGGTLGIGRAIVEEIAQLGASVYTCARNSDVLNQCIDEWKKEGLDVNGCIADVSTEDGRNTLLDGIRATWPQQSVHGLVNNVGTNIRKRAIEYSADEFDKIMQTNLHSAFKLTQQMHSILNKDGKGSCVVNIGSVAGGCGTAMRSGVVYAMTKAALTQMTYNLACEWAKENIRVNTIAPWYINTPLVQPVLQNPETLQAVLNKTPMGRIGQPDEVSSIAAYFLMDCASYITGQVVAVDGGFLRSGFF